MGECSSFSISANNAVIKILSPYKICAIRLCSIIAGSELVYWKWYTGYPRKYIRAEVALSVFTLSTSAGCTNTWLLRESCQERNNAKCQEFSKPFTILAPKPNSCCLNVDSFASGERLSPLVLLEFLGCTFVIMASSGFSSTTIPFFWDLPTYFSFFLADRNYPSMPLLYTT